MELKMKYFVLKPEGNDLAAHASRAAMRIYAEVMSNGGELGFAAEIVRWVNRESNRFTLIQAYGPGDK